MRTIGQSSNYELLQEEIKLISEKTDNKEILFCKDDYVIFREHPRYCYRRVYDGLCDVELAKNNKILDDQIENIQFEK